jgi:hypothetical protein
VEITELIMTLSTSLEQLFLQRKVKLEDLNLFFTEITNSNSQSLRLSQDQVTEDLEPFSKPIDLQLSELDEIFKFITFIKLFIYFIYYLSFKSPNFNIQIHSCSSY